jgi:hypothetical protein
MGAAVSRTDHFDQQLANVTSAKSLQQFVQSERSFPFTGDVLGGIFSSVTSELHCSPIACHLIQVVPCDTACIYINALFSSDGDKFWHSHDRPMRWIAIHFLSCTFHMTGYTLQAAEVGRPQSWAVEGAADSGIHCEWEPIDEVRMDQSLWDRLQPQYFGAVAERPFSQFRICQTEKNCDDRPSDYFGLRRIEFFGKLIRTSRD